MPGRGNWRNYGTFFIAVFISLLPLEILNGQCQRPFALQPTSIGTDRATIQWNSSIIPEADSIEIDLYRTVENDDGIADAIAPNIDSLILTGLSQGTQYSFRLRSVCDGQRSNWSSQRSFLTHLGEDAPCLLDIHLQEENCMAGAEDEINIEISSAPPGILGEDVFLDYIALIIEHDWVAELHLYLENPVGDRILLSETNQSGVDHYGNPMDSSCTQVARFQAKSCDKVVNYDPPYVGVFQPAEPFTELYTGSGANGIWKLVICDENKDDLGIVKFVEFRWRTTFCERPETPEVAAASDNGVDLMFNSDPDCDNITFEIVPAGFAPRYPEYAPYSMIYEKSCDSLSYTLDGLSSSTSYDLYVYRICGDGVSPPSCRLPFQTLCHKPAYRSSFDLLDPCVDDCAEECVIADQFWYNITEDDSDWIAFQGNTPTEGTGPEESFPPGGTYLYYESSGPGCQGDTETILESNCLLVKNAEGACHMNFHAYISGIEASGIEVRVSSNGGLSWDTLMHVNNREEAWVPYSVNLDNYRDESVQVRIIAFGSSGSNGDIAIDNITLAHVEFVSNDSITYFRDLDGDLYGDDMVTMKTCRSNPPSGYALVGGDCNDQDPSINPGAMEIFCNLVDENCNGMADDQPSGDPLSINVLSLEHALCPGVPSGSIEVAAQGGQPPYMFDWSNGSADSVISMLPAGSYRCTVTDQTGCKVETISLPIIHQHQVNWQVLESIHPSCVEPGGGAISIVPQGANPPYEIFWNTGDTSLAIDSLAEGQYRVTITQVNGCIFQSPVYELVEESIYQLETDVTHVRCFGDSTGMIEVDIEPAANVQEYHWSTGDTSSRLENMPSGYYALTVEDEQGCRVKSDSIFIDQPDPLSYRIVALDPVSCNGGEDGRILVDISGGTPAISSIWDNGQETQPGNDLINAKAGAYILYIGDGNKCSLVSDTIYLPEPDPIVLTLDSLNNPNCEQSNDGFIRIQASGGMEPYEYEWDTGKDTSNVLRDASPGLYRLKVTDALGCEQYSSFFSLDPASDGLELNITQTDSVSCFGERDGQLVAEISDAMGKVTFQWSTGQKTTKSSLSDTLDDIGAGLYSLLVQDEMGCSASETKITVLQPEVLIVDEIIREHPLCAGDSNGMIEIIPAGGTPPFSFLWDDGSQNGLRTELPSGAFTLTLSDARGCERQSNQIILLEPDSLFVEIEIMDETGAGQNGMIKVEPLGGNAPYTISWIDRPNLHGRYTIDSLSSGIYVFRIIDANGCAYLDSAIITGVTSIDQSVQSNTVKIFPNPGNGTYFIAKASNSHVNIDRVDIYNANGKSLQKLYPGANNRVQVDLSLFGPGMYVARIKLTNGAILTRKLINQ